MDTLRTADYSFDKAMHTRNHRFSLYVFSAIAIFSVFMPMIFTSDNDPFPIPLQLAIVGFVVFFIFTSIYLTLKYREYKSDYIMFCAGSHIEKIVHGTHNGDYGLFTKNDFDIVESKMKRLSNIDVEEIKRGIMLYLKKCP